MADPLITDTLSLAQSLGRHPKQLILPEEGSIAVRLAESRMAVTRRGANLAELREGDFILMDLDRVVEVISLEPVPPEDLATAQMQAEPGAAPDEDFTVYAWLFALDPALRIAVHIHPVAVDQVIASPRARQFAERRTVHNEVLALGSSSLLVNYADPGMGLTREIQKKMVLWRDRYKSVPRIVLVQNHGVILVGETAAGLLRLIDALLKYAELFAGASILGGPIFMTPQAITQIEQHLRGE